MIEQDKINGVDLRAAPRPTTKDAGRVKLGGGAIHFGDAVPAREATKDSGRVKLGGGAIQF